MTKEIKETIKWFKLDLDNQEGWLKTVRSMGSKALIEITERRIEHLSTAIGWGEALEQAEGETEILGERKAIEHKIVNMLTVLVFGFCDLTAKQQEERVVKTMEILVELGKNIARPILAKAILENKEKDKRIAELEKR